jgi:hypothetical protein
MAARRSPIAAAWILGLAGVTAAAQIDLFPRLERRRLRVEAPEADAVAYDGRFVFVRLRYASEGTGGFGFRREPPWAHDYPRGERNFTKILNEITLISPHLEESSILDLDDPALCDYPIAYMSEPGFWMPTDEEAAGLGRYLAKGGFVIFDDFRGYDWENFAAQMRRVLPEGRFLTLDATHPVFHSFFEIDSLDFVQYYDEGPPEFYGLFEDNDPARRLLVIANYNNDLSEYWEFSDTGFVPIDLSNEAYKLGVNYVVYAMTH